MKRLNDFSKSLYYQWVNILLFIYLITANLFSGHYHIKICRLNMEYSKLYLSLLLLLNWKVNIAYCPLQNTVCQ